jgi:hypothetical protein
MDTDKTVQNDEEVLEANESNDDNSTGEGESTEGESTERTYTEAELNERLEAERKERDKRWRERLKKAGGEEDSQESHQKADSKEKVASDDVVLARLEARGVLDTDIQSYLLKEADRLKKNPVELLSDDYYSNKISEMKKEKEQVAATPAPSSRTGTNDRSNDLGYWLKQAEKGQLPPDPAMRRKVVQKLAGR